MKISKKNEKYFFGNFKFYIGKIFFTKGIFTIFNKYFFKIKFLHDEKIFFVRIFLKPLEKVVSFPTHPTRGVRIPELKDYKENPIDSKLKNPMKIEIPEFGFRS